MRNVPPFIFVRSYAPNISPTPPTSSRVPRVSHASDNAYSCVDKCHTFVFRKVIDVLRMENQREPISAYSTHVHSLRDCKPIVELDVELFRSAPNMWDTSY